jgi:hypothetical protein
VWTVTLQSSVGVIIKVCIILTIYEVKWDNVFIFIILNYLCVYKLSGRSFGEDDRVIRK